MNYDFPLVDWIGAGLNSKNLEETTNAIRANESLDAFIGSRKSNARYIQKIMREEVIKQFSDWRRPALEVVLNAIDARPKNMTGNYEIDIDLGRRELCCHDNGSGMNLDDILRYLIVPFNTRKTGVEEIGRFGVGFLSTFNFCLRNPDKNKIVVETKTGEEGHRVEFYSTGEEAEGLRMRIGKTWRKGPAGTTVLIRAGMDRKDMTQYLSEHLQNIPSYRAAIRINNKSINDDSNHTLYVEPVKLALRDGTIEQKFGMKFSDKKKIMLTAQGILIKEKQSHLSGADLLFPPAIHVVEGRDEFKKDANYKTCTDAAFRMVERHIKENRNERVYMIEFLPSLMAALDIQKLSDIPNIKGIKDALLPGKEYVTRPEQFEPLMAFIGDSLQRKIFGAGVQSYSYWKEQYKRQHDFLDTYVKPVDIITMGGRFQKIRKAYETTPNVAGIINTGLDHHNTIHLVKVDAHGKNPFYSRGNALLINVSHPLVDAPYHHARAYELVSQYFELQRVRDQSKNKSFEGAEKNLRANLGGALSARS